MQETTKPGRQIIAPNEFFIEKTLIDSKYSKMTVNPCTGRITLKISKSVNDPLIGLDLLQLAGMVSNQDWEPATFRGKIKYNERNSSYTWEGGSGNKKFNKKITLNK